MAAGRVHGECSWPSVRHAPGVSCRTTSRITLCSADISLSIYQCIVSWHEPYLRLIEKLLPVMPDPSLDSFFFWNSGSEAVEGAMKIARIYTGRKAMITMQGRL